MKELKEQVQVNVTEIPDEQVMIKQVDVTLNTLESNSANASTQLINGILKNVQIKTNKPVHIKISFGEIIIYENKQFEGIKYFALKVDSLNNIGERFNFAPGEWCINNSLDIAINGQLQTQVDVNLYYV